MDNIIIFALVGLLVGFSKGGLGGPVPIALTVPLMSLVIPTQEAVGLVLPLLIFADMFALYFYWKEWDSHYIRLMLVAGLIGIAVGTFVLKDIDEITLKRIIGSLTIVALSFKILSDRLKSIEYKPRDWHGWVAGWASGFGSALANVGAPPFTAYLLLQPKMTPRKFVGTATLYFAIVNLVKVPGYISLQILDFKQFLSVAWVTVIIPFAIWFARWIIHRINQQTFEWLMMIPLFLLSLGLIFGS